jgi:hypothetical protein
MYLECTYTYIPKRFGMTYMRVRLSDDVDVDLMKCNV